MSLEYVERKIEEALKSAKGNQTRARQLIIKWSEDDIRLLHGLTKAHLNGIVAYNIERVASGRSAKARTKGTAAAARPRAKETPRESSKDSREKFGMEILKAVVSSSSLFGLDADAKPRSRQASAQHVEAIKKLAAKSKNKK